MIEIIFDFDKYQQITSNVVFGVNFIHSKKNAGVVNTTPAYFLYNYFFSYYSFTC